MEQLLPSGAYEVSGTQRIVHESGEVSVTNVSGYVDFGPEPGGRGCASEVQLSEEASVFAEGGPARVVLVQEPGGQVWVRAEAAGSSPEWRDLGDPSAALGVVTPPLFLPFWVTSGSFGFPAEGVAGGVLCSIAEVGRFMRVLSQSPQEVVLELDAEVANQLASAGSSRWVDGFVEAGIAGGDRALLVDAARKLSDDSWWQRLLPMSDSDVKYALLGQPTDEFLSAHWPGTVVEFSPAPASGGPFTLRQVSSQASGVAPEWELVFTPAEPREVSVPQQDTYFERVRAGL